jgi:chemosensory pili system protein ChpA (sensor histidine kinase/response regulator)
MQGNLDILRAAAVAAEEQLPAAAEAQVDTRQAQAAPLAPDATAPVAEPVAAAFPGRALLAKPVTTNLAPQRAASNQAVRVRSQLLDRLVNQAGEVMITRSRLEAELRQLRGSLTDLTGNLDRLRAQLRDIELQAEVADAVAPGTGQGLGGRLRPARVRPVHAGAGADPHDGRVSQRRGHRAAQPAAHGGVH